MLSKHDELLLKDLKLQPVWLMFAYLAVGVAALGVAIAIAGLRTEILLGAGGGFLVALGAEKLVTRRIRQAAASVLSESNPV